MARQLSGDGAAFIVRQEGAVPYWYVDATGHWTIGVGHLWSGDQNEFADVEAVDSDGSVTPGRRLTESEMADLFRADAARYVEAVDRLVTGDLTQRQFDMLVDFAFNWGIGDASGFPATSVLRLVNAGDFAAVAVELVDGRGPATAEHPNGRRYDKDLPGVRRRRQEEAAAFAVAAEPMTPVEVIRAATADLEAQGIGVQYVAGWEDRGRPYAFTPRGLLWHHTATGGYDYDYPSLGIVRDGRSDLPGPLAQFGLGRHTGTVYVIAAGYANHAGGGGWDGLSGNGSVWGIEAENDGVGEEWGPEIRRSYVALSAALARHGGFETGRICRHAEWSDGGKIDTATAPLDDGDWIRARVAEALAGGTPDNPPEEDDDMALPIFGDAPAERPDSAGLWEIFGPFRKRVHTPQVWSAWEALGAKHVGVIDLAMFDSSIDIEAALASHIVVAEGGATVDTDAVARKVADVLYGRLAS